MNWRIFIWPLQPPGVILIVTYTLLARGLLFLFDGVQASSSLLSAQFIMVILSGLWYFIVASLVNYAQKTLAHVSRGLLGEAIKEETELNPFQSALALKGTATLIIPFATWVALGPSASALELIVPAVLFPIIWLNTALDESLFSALQPRRFARLISGLGLHMPSAVILVSGSAGYLTYVMLWQHDVLSLLLSAYGFLMCNMLAGQVLYWRRNHMDLQTEKSPEQTHALELGAEFAAMNHLFDELHRLCASGSLKKAYDQLVNYMGEDIDQLDPIIHQRLMDFQDKRLTLQHGVHYLQRLADRGDRKKAWTVMKTCLTHDEQFRPLTAQTLLDLTHAAQHDDAALVNEVLGNFADAYPNSELISHARFRQARVATELLGDAQCGRELLHEISKSDPEFADTDEFQRYAKRLNLS